MENNPGVHLEEVIFGSADKKRSAQVSKLQRSGKIRKIAPRLYTSNLTDTSEEIVRRNLFIILGNLYPGAILSHRSAFEFKPTEKGHIFLTYKYTRKIIFPGITIRLLKGPDPIEGDIPFTGQLHVSQQARAFLENLQHSKRPGPTSKTLSIKEIEEKLDQIARINGEDELNSLRDKAAEIEDKLDMHREFVTLNKLIGAILSTHNTNVLASPLAAARALGFPYDPRRLQLFEELFRVLHSKDFKHLPDKNTSKESFENFAFFESYFSNYIEGTEFEINEARQIIESEQPIPARGADSHDILGTYRIVSSKKEMMKTPNSADELISLLKYRHKILLGGRPRKAPGLFKDRNNFAGQTAFVDFNLVKGTLIKSFDFYHALTHPFARAAYMMFVISEVHPFLDGNGRIARVMMNAELVSQGQSKIIIPTVYRDDYLGVLRKLSRQEETTSYIRMLQYASEFSSTIYSDNRNEMQKQLDQSNAFTEHTEGKLKIIKRS